MTAPRPTGTSADPPGGCGPAWERPGARPAVRRLTQGASWLLWLALLLPMAQSVAAWHGYTHVKPDASEREDGKPAPHAAHCDFCLAAASAAGSALLGGPPSFMSLAARHELPRPAVRGVWQAPVALAYQSRAPPLVPR